MSPARYIRDAAIFAPCYIALDWASYIDPLGPFNITPWNPQPALAIAWMLLGGLQYAPVVFLTIVLADLVVRDMPGGYLIMLLTALTLAAGYAGIAWTLRSLVRLDPGLRSTRELTLFAGVVVVGTAVIGASFVGVLHAAHLIAPASFPQAWLRFWVGDAVGVLVTAPLLLLAADTARRTALRALARRPETFIQIAVLVGALWLVFGVFGDESSRYFYILFLPLIWIAARGGMNGAVFATAVVQLGVVIGIHQERAAMLPVLELQALVAALTLTGLVLGMMVDERERGAESLRRTLRLAAAGEMAGAIAHEVNQPLTALANYGRSAQMLLASGGGAHAELPSVLQKILVEANRAAEVVRRLRDFFRTGTTRLEPLPLEELLATVRRIGQPLIGGLAITLEVRSEPNLPALFVDRLQIELVLRNLIANSVDSLQALPDRQGRIDVAAQRHDMGHVRVVVTDNGPGLAAGMREQVFEPFVSGKSSGMGLGLAVSRAMAEAHGGSLEARPGVHGEFELILPCVVGHE